MPFICEFEMRVKGKEHDVNDCVKSLSCLFLHHYQTININDDKMAFVYGKCINSINEFSYSPYILSLIFIFIFSNE